MASGAGAAPRTRRRAPAGKLSRRGRRAIDHRGDLLERDGEDVMENEGESLRRRELLQDHQQRESDRVGDESGVFGIALVGGSDDRVGHVDGVEVLLATGLSRAEHVEADPGDDGRQPAAEVLDVVDVGSLEPDPRLLEGIVGVGDRPEHAIGHRPQVRSLLLEARCQPLPFIHRSHSSIPSGRLLDRREAANVTQAPTGPGTERQARRCETGWQEPARCERTNRAEELRPLRGRRERRTPKPSRAQFSIRAGDAVASEDRPAQYRENRPVPPGHRYSLRLRSPDPSRCWVSSGSPR